MNIRISIITPTFNQGGYIEQAIRSVGNQNYNNLEYLIIDGGSTDNTLKVISKYQNLISYCVSEKDNGQTDAINKGFKRATGDILNWLNSDDLLTSESLVKIAEAFQKHPEIDIIYGDTNQIRENGDLVYVNKVVPFDWNMLLYGRILAAQPSVFFRRSLLKRIGFLDENLYFCMDLDFWIRAGKQNAVFMPLYETLSCNRFHKNTKTMKYRGILESEHRSIHKKMKLPYTKTTLTDNKTVYNFIRNSYRLKYGAMKMLHRKDFEINQSHKIRKQTRAS